MYIFKLHPIEEVFDTLICVCVQCVYAELGLHVL